MFYHNLFSTLGMEAKNQERPQKVVCCGSGDETCVLILEERRGSKDLKLTYLLHWLTWFSEWLCWLLPRECLLELGSETKV